MQTDIGNSINPVDFSTRHSFDTQRYPLDRPIESSEYRRLIDKAKTGLAEKNCARLSGFIRPEILKLMQAEAAELAPGATFTQNDFNPYFSVPPDDVPDDHPLKRFSSRRHGMIRADKFNRKDAIWAVFQNTDLLNFVARCLDLEELYPYQDPFGQVNVNVQPAGCEFPWHFDHNDFTISIGLKLPDSGGCFEFVPDIRTDQDENYNAVKKVLDGECSSVQKLYLRPGDLQLFKGGYTLHRVSAPMNEERHSLLLSYVTDPSHIASPEYSKRLWGEVHPMHLAATTPTGQEDG